MSKINPVQRQINKKFASNKKLNCFILKYIRRMEEANLALEKLCSKKQDTK
jgi:hypothetical protein